MKEKKTSVAAIVGLVFAILALLLSAVPIINNFAFVLAVIGLLCGVTALVAVKKGKKSGKGISIATIIISIVAFGVVLASQQMYSDAIDQVSEEVNDSIDRSTGEKTDEILGTEVDVNLGEFTATTDEYGLSTTSLPVEVVNKLDESKSYSIQVEVVDGNGKRIADDYINANDLGANQSQDFEAFQYVEDSKLNAVKAGTFKIVSVSQM